MQTLTEIVAAVVVHSSAAAFSPLGVPVEAHQAPRPAPAERTIARTSPKPTAVADCPQSRAKAVKT